MEFRPGVQSQLKLLENYSEMGLHRLCERSSKLITPITGFSAQVSQHRPNQGMLMAHKSQLAAFSANDFQNKRREAQEPKPEPKYQYFLVLRDRVLINS